MPRKRRLIRHRRESQEVLSSGMKYFLATGHDFRLALETGTSNTPPELLERAAAEAWRRHRRDIMDEWISEHPLTRPWAWWAYDAPERRRCLSGTHPHDNPERERIIRECEREHPGYREQVSRLSYGMPNALMLRSDFDAIYETTADYLERLNLMDPSERIIFDSPGFQPPDEHGMRRVKMK